MNAQITLKTLMQAAEESSEATESVEVGHHSDSPYSFSWVRIHGKTCFTQVDGSQVVYVSHRVGCEAKTMEIARKMGLMLVPEGNTFRTNDSHFQWNQNETVRFYSKDLRIEPEDD